MKNILEKLKEDDIEYIQDLLRYAEMYLENKVTNEEIIDEMNQLCTIYFNLADPNLSGFKLYWSEIDDIEKEIETGESSIRGKVDTTKKDLKDYIESKTEEINILCNRLLKTYTPILKELEEKYKVD
jgi:hypothetical protein